MALFRRKAKIEAPDMPPELQTYYQAEKREKSWMAWALGLATLVVTILLALALFFGGRWIYRKVRNEPAKVTTVQTDNEAKETPKATTPEPAAPSTPTTPSNTGTSSTSTNTPRAATPGSSDLPNTGPADTLAIFVAVSVLAYFVHRRLLTN